MTKQKPKPMMFRVEIEATIICHGTCKETFTYTDDGVSVDCMPDGCLLDGKWYCDECIRDKNGNLLLEFQ